MRRFVLVRNQDPSGVSGTGLVVEGVQFSDGTVAMRWLSPHSSSVVFGSIESVEIVHGHQGKTTISWLDP